LTKTDIEKKVYELIVGSQELDNFSSNKYNSLPTVRRILDLHVENYNISSPNIVVACFTKSSESNTYRFDVSVTVEVLRDFTIAGTIETSSVVEEERENIDIVSEIIQDAIKLGLRGTSSSIDIESEFYLPQGEESLFEIMLFKIEIKKCITKL